MMNNNLIKIAGILLALILVLGCSSKIPPEESRTTPADTSSVTDTGEPSPAPSQDPGDTVREIGGTLYAYQNPDGTRSTFLLDSYRPFILQDIPDHLHDWLQKYTTAAVVVTGTAGTEDSYPRQLYVSDVQYANVDYVDFEIGFLQRMAALGWKSVVGIPGAFPPFLLMTDP